MRNLFKNRKVLYIVIPIILLLLFIVIAEMNGKGFDRSHAITLKGGETFPPKDFYKKF